MPRRAWRSGCSMTGIERSGSGARGMKWCRGAGRWRPRGRRARARLRVALPNPHQAEETEHAPARRQPPAHPGANAMTSTRPRPDRGRRHGTSPSAHGRGRPRSRRPDGRAVSTRTRRGPRRWALEYRRLDAGASSRLISQHGLASRSPFGCQAEQHRSTRVFRPLPAGFTSSGGSHEPAETRGSDWPAPAPPAHRAARKRAANRIAPRAVS